MVAHVEFLMFDDIDASEPIGGLKPMSKNDAKHIVDAFLHYSDTVSQIIVHCDAGYSRSPAVAAALTKALGESDDQYLPQYACLQHSAQRTGEPWTTKIVAETCELRKMKNVSCVRQLII